MLLQILNCLEFVHLDIESQAKRQITATDGFGNTALHMALHHKPPVDSVALLLEVASRTVVQGDSNNTSQKMRFSSVAMYKP